jgi:Mn-dependent DtxR family transcriptional regulator
MLKDYQEEALFRMFDNRIIAMDYHAVEKVASIIKWQDIAKKYKVKKSFSNVLRNLHSKGYVDFHGKSGDVVSLSRLGTDYVMGKKTKP